ncbi:FAD-binding domain-containing protein [Hydrotalea sp.]|uniref:FAD-binding domain-containing protein n=1 Tax=Hydrotalea sp. TaxID=2881279 RepID=UPI003D0EA06B
MLFSTQFEAIEKKVTAINPIAYASTRNYLNGNVTYLSPYISRGVISTQFILQQLIKSNYSFQQCKVLLQELAWRDYYQQVWLAKGESINENIYTPIHAFIHVDIPKAIVNAQTGIAAIDDGIQQLYNTGYMHNHCRMYTAALACNIAQTHWLKPAQWMYYYLLDGDWASNALSWQWIAGTFSKKQYVANQENINKYTGTHQTNTYLDVTYDALPLKVIPDILRQHEALQLNTPLPNNLPPLQINTEVPTLVYNYYNIDPLWLKGTKANRVFILEPEIFKQYPVSEQCLRFALQLTQNIPNLQIFVGSFNELYAQCNNHQIIYKQHPLNKHYKGISEAADFMIPEINGFYPSFFSYWNKIAPRLEKLFQ